ncbi:MAG: RnfH family protein [Xanthomonadales bacterium]|nr:RnfH family protein [Xanthomonadales bacterium]
MSAPALRVSVVCAWPDRVWRSELALSPGSTVDDALQASHWRTELAEIADQLAVAVHGQPVRPDRPLVDGDRIELCRPLRVDPREARRRQVASTARRPG